LFIEHVGKVVNLPKDEQILIPGVMELCPERIERDPKGLFKLYPFVMERTPNEPRLINPAVGFGKPVIAGTGISTAVVSSSEGSTPGNPCPSWLPNMASRQNRSKKQSGGSSSGRQVTLPEDVVLYLDENLHS
jgi:hypothetical protein